MAILSKTTITLQSYNINQNIENLSQLEDSSEESEISENLEQNEFENSRYSYTMPKSNLFDFRNCTGIPLNLFNDFLWRN